LKVRDQDILSDKISFQFQGKKINNISLGLINKASRRANVWGSLTKALDSGEWLASRSGLFIPMETPSVPAG
jgi:hypothetical protein